MNDPKIEPMALVILEELKDELSLEGKSYRKSIETITKATQSSLKDEADTDPSNVELSFDQEPFRGILKELLRNIVEAEKLESEHAIAVKRKKLCVEQLRIEVQELFDLDEIRISHSLGAVIRLTEEEIRQKEKAEREENEHILDIVASLLDREDVELEAFCEGDGSDDLEPLHEDRLEPFYVDIAQFIVENGEEGRELIESLTKQQEEVLEKVLASKKAPKPISFLAEVVKMLMQAA